MGATRNIGLFGIVELVKSRQTMEPLAPFNGTSPEMAALGQELRAARPLHDRALEHVLHEPAPVHQRGANCAKAFDAIDKALSVVDRMLAPA